MPKSLWIKQFTLRKGVHTRSPDLQNTPWGYPILGLRRKKVQLFVCANLIIPVQFVSLDLWLFFGTKYFQMGGPQLNRLRTTRPREQAVETAQEHIKYFVHVLQNTHNTTIWCGLKKICTFLPATSESSGLSHRLRGCPPDTFSEMIWFWRRGITYSDRIHVIIVRSNV